jgi:hypothetical protein
LLIGGEGTHDPGGEGHKTDEQAEETEVGEPAVRLTLPVEGVRDDQRQGCGEKQHSARSDGIVPH